MVIPTNNTSQSWWGVRDLNPYALQHWNLNPACLPIPPTPQIIRRQPLTTTSFFLQIRLANDIKYPLSTLIIVIPVSDVCPNV